MTRVADYDGMTRLLDYILQEAARRAHLLNYKAPEATVKRVARGDTLVVDNDAQARLSVLMAHAFEQMRKDMFPDEVDEERRRRATPITKERAVVLVREHKGIRAAARAEGVSHVAILRALERDK